MFRCPIREDLDLRLVEELHAEEMFNMVERNRGYLREWLPWVDTTRSAEDIRNFVRTAMKQFGENDGYQAGIWFEGRYVGGIGFHRINWPNRRVELGYWIAQEVQGRGFVGLACRQLIQYAFDTLKLNRVEIHCGAGNVRSNRIAQRLGFQLDGRLRGAMLLHGKYHDLNIYGMLAADWTEHGNAER